MKTKKLLFAILSVLMIQVYGQQFQINYEVANKHYHDLNIAPPLQDGTNDFVVAANLFDSASNSVISLKRIDQNGNVVGIQEYTAAAFPETRVFDIATYMDLLYMTGSVQVSGKSKVFVARIEAASGNVLDLNYYDMISTNMESVGFHISFTNSDANGDGSANPGFVIAGTMGFCNPLDTNASSCGVKEGFVLRVDMTLNEIWTTEIESIVSGNNLDYDMANHITETSDGFFITGSATGEDAFSNWQQAVLAHKINFQSVKQWDKSYIFGNSQDVSVDAYYDTTSDEIYMLSNYSATHQFAVTVFENVTGNIVPAKTWYVTQSDLNHYGFSLTQAANPNNLLISGYDRSETWTNSGTTYNSKTNLFVYEFEKATGAQVGFSYQYLVENDELVSDPYNFWNGQMPLIYYPDISFMYEPIGIVNYYHIGYKTGPDATTDYTNANVFKTSFDKNNECDNLELIFNAIAPTLNLLPNVDSLAGLTVTEVAFTMTNSSIVVSETDCDAGLAVNESKINTNLVVYPNPVKDYLHFKVDNILSYKVYDVYGRLVKSNSLGNSQSINTESLSKGVYFIKLIGKNNTVYSSKFLKQ